MWGVHLRGSFQETYQTMFLFQGIGFELGEEAPQKISTLAEGTFFIMQFIIAELDVCRELL